MSARNWVNGFGRRRGTAAIETAIVMPLYLIMVYALLFFGYSTLARQKELTAGAYAAWTSQGQSAGEALQKFFPWTGASLDHDRLSGAGSEAQAGDSTLELSDAVDSATPNDLDHVTLSLWTLGIGEVYQDFVFANGQVQQRMRINQDDAARYITRNQISDPTAAHAPTKYTRWVTQTLNGAGNGGNWLERRQADLKFTFKPHYLGLVYGNENEEMKADQYLGMNAPEPDFVPEYDRTFKVVARGDLKRLGATTVELGALQRRMEVLVGGGCAMEPCMDATGLAALKDAYWPQVAGSLWAPK